MDIAFETGLQEFNLAGKVTVQFNPADVTFAEKIYTAFKALEDKQDGYRKEIEAVKEPIEVFKIAHRLDTEMRDILNGLFGKDIVTPLIGDCNVYALADGLPIWANILMAVIDVMDESVSAATKRSKQRIDKYTKKYHR